VKMCKVMFLGAGASKDAGYPLTNELFSKMDSFYERENSIYQEKNDWTAFKKFRESSEGLIGNILRANNPELVLTVPDLLYEAMNEEERNAFQKYLEAIKNNHADNQETINDIYDKSPHKNAVKNASDMKAIQHQFLKAISAYFTYINNEVILNLSHKNKENISNGKNSYVKNMLHDCVTVISTNWDTLAEYSLMKNDLWSPIDGYGFKIKSVPSKNTTVRYPKSQIKVLKLHGSIGWIESSDKKEIYLDETYSSHLLIRPKDNNISFSKRRISLADQSTREVRSQGPKRLGEQFLILPSYIKQLDNTYLQSIWNQASTALKKATEVIFVGYSLPSADVAIRALLNPLRKRIEGKRISSKRLKITVVIGKNDKEVENRWKQFLGEDIIVDTQTALKKWGT
jgi:hypothetical protein